MSYFWTGTTLDDFLFKGLNINSSSGITGVFFGVLGVAVIYECLRTFRDFLLYRFLSTCSLRKENEITLQTIEKVPCANSCEKTPVESNVDLKTNVVGSLECDENKINNGNGTCEKGATATTADLSSSLNKIEVCPTEPNIVLPPSSKSPEDSSSGLKKQKKKFVLLLLSTLLHMCYTCCGYTLMLAVMTFNVWILVSAVIGIGIGFFVCDTMRQAELVKNSGISWLTPRNIKSTEPIAKST